MLLLESLMYKKNPEMISYALFRIVGDKEFEENFFNPIQRIFDTYELKNLSKRFTKVHSEIKDLTVTYKDVLNLKVDYNN